MSCCNGNMIVNQLVPWSRVFLQQSLVLQMTKKFIAFHGTCKFITVIEKDRPVPILIQINSVHALPSCLWYILILPSRLCLCLPCDVLSGFPTKSLYACVLYRTLATFFTHFLLLDFTILMSSEKYKPCSSSIRTFLQRHGTSSLLRPNVCIKWQGEWITKWEARERSVSRYPKECLYGAKKNRQQT